MNKITVVKDKILAQLDQTVVYEDSSLIVKENTDIAFDFEYSNIQFNILIKPNITVKIISRNRKSKNQINYKIEKNSILDIIHLNIDCSDKIELNLDGEKAKINYYYSTINKNKNIYKVTLKHNKSKTESNIVNHGVNLGHEKLCFEVDGIILKESDDCICNQDNKIIVTKPNTAQINPNLLIDNYNVEANHAAYIGRFKDSDLFYLMSRGISEKKCYELLLEGFLIGNLKLKKQDKDWLLNELKE